MSGNQQVVTALQAVTSAQQAVGAATTTTAVRTGVISGNLPSPFTSVPIAVTGAAATAGQPISVLSGVAAGQPARGDVTFGPNYITTPETAAALSQRLAFARSSGQL